MWFEESVFYQIYPLTLCGAPADHELLPAAAPGALPPDGVSAPAHRILRLTDFAPYLRTLGVRAVYLNPLMESDTHGYDTRDYRLPDRRLGSAEDVKAVVAAFHENGIRVVFDGVFNHAGRGFFAFQDVKRYGRESRYRDWFHLDFNGDSPYGDGFWYEGWEGHYELVRLKLENPELQQYLFESVRLWFHEFDIDGLRLDVAYLLPLWFISMLKQEMRALKPDAFLLAEILGDNAGRFYSEGQADAITDYPGYKALWSSFNSLNLFELAHTVRRNYLEMYRGQRLFSFADNHDVERIASRLTDPEKLPLIYALLLTLPGIPCIYYGSEWGTEGRKEAGSDASLRPAFAAPQPNALTEQISALIHLRNDTPELSSGSYRELLLTNRSFAFAREYEGNVSTVAVNLDSETAELHLPDGRTLTLPPKRAAISRRDDTFRLL